MDMCDGGYLTLTTTTTTKPIATKCHTETGCCATKSLGKLQ